MTTRPLTDSTGRSWTLANSLGRGLWGRSRLLRDAEGHEAVLKEPLTAGEFPADAGDPSELARACTAAAREQAEQLAGRAPFPQPTLLATIDLGEGRTGLVLPRFPTSLQAKLASRTSLEQVLEIVLEVARRVREAERVHGNLRPSNIFFDASGSVVLADALPPSVRPHFRRLSRLAGAEAWTPPEARQHPAPTWDTWALAQSLHAACLALPELDPPPPPRLASAGLGKDALAEIKERVLVRLADEASNPRFRARVSDRMGKLLSRALAPRFEPSPPYRFVDLASFTERVAEVHALVRPKVVDVSRILLPGRADDATFVGGDLVEFSVSVKCAPALTDHQDLICGIQLVDLDAPPGEGRLPAQNAQFHAEAQPSGRLRYKLGLPDIPPGRYRVKVVFAVRESGDDPLPTHVDVEVRPPPGYVPPRREPPPPSPLPFPGATAAEGREPTTDADTEGGAREAAGRPRPVPPPEEVDDEPSVPEAVDDEAGTEPEAGTVAEAETEPAGSASGSRAGSAALGSGGRHGPWRPQSLPEADPEADTALSPPPVLPPPETTYEGDTPAPVRPVELPAAVDDGALENAGEDLPVWGAEEPPPPGPLARFADALKRDSTLAFGVAIAGSLALVVGLSLLMRAC